MDEVPQIKIKKSGSSSKQSEGTPTKMIDDEETKQPPMPKFTPLDREEEKKPAQPFRFPNLNLDRQALIGTA